MRDVGSSRPERRVSRAARRVTSLLHAQLLYLRHRRRRRGVVVRDAKKSGRRGNVARDDDVRARGALRHARRSVHRRDTSFGVRRRDHGRVFVRDHVRRADAQRGESDLCRVLASVWCGRPGVRVLRDDGRGGGGGGGIGDHHRAVPPSTDGQPPEHQSAEGLMLLQEVTSPLGDTAARWMWALPLLPLLGFVLNGALALFGAYRPGPADPGAHPHDAHPSAEETHEAPAGGHDVTGGGAHGDDRHVVIRHRFATLTSIIGPGVMVLAFALAAVIFLAMQRAGSAERHAPFIQRYFEWMPVDDLHIDAAFQLDQLSMVMILVITGVGMLIHIFSVGYMRDDPGYPRYFAYLNLFVAFMLVLVMGASYPVMFVGWEGVGLCSYLLIGFWYLDKANADAGKKAFIMNRIGDVGFLVAMFMLYANLGTLEFESIRAQLCTLGPTVITWICLFFFLGCAGKSAQIPLYTWLPDAMAGPTPVSALIHAATMVTAGIYMIARSNIMYSLAPVSMMVVAIVGLATAILAATIALKQNDIKKVLAYSTVSQLGYMFLGLGVGAYTGAVFHVITHAFFKALLFLGAGSVIHAMGGEQDIRK